MERDWVIEVLSSGLKGKRRKTRVARRWYIPAWLRGKRYSIQEAVQIWNERSYTVWPSDAFYNVTPEEVRFRNLKTKEVIPGAIFA